MRLVVYRKSTRDQLLALVAVGQPATSAVDVDSPDAVAIVRGTTITSVVLLGVTPSELAAASGLWMAIETAMRSPSGQRV